MNTPARRNDHYGINERSFVTSESKAKQVNGDALTRVGDVHVRMSLELQQSFGLRREEAIKFQPRYADCGDHIAIKDSWTKEGEGARDPAVHRSAARTLRPRPSAGRARLADPGRSQLPRATAHLRRAIRELDTHRRHCADAGPDPGTCRSASTPRRPVHRPLQAPVGLGAGGQDMVTVGARKVASNDVLFDV